MVLVRPPFGTNPDERDNDYRMSKRERNTSVRSSTLAPEPTGFSR